MIDWSAGYSLEWRVYEVNTDTWADAGMVFRMSQLKVSNDASKDIIQTGSLTFTSPVGEALRERYLRVALVAESSDSRERVDVATMLWRSTSGSIARRSDTRSLVGSSVLYPASRESLPDMFYAPAGVNGAEYAADILRACLTAPVDVYGDGFTLDATMYFELDTKRLMASRRLLEAGGYTIQISGNGTVMVMPMPSQPALVIDRSNARMLGNVVSYKADSSEMPNRYRAVDGQSQVTIENDDPDSPISHIVRGYWDDVTDRSPKRVNGETLYAYANRKLEEASVLKIPYSYQRKWTPDVLTDSIIACGLPEMSGAMRVSKQVITCDRSGISMQEEAQMEEALWRG